MQKYNPGLPLVVIVDADPLARKFTGSVLHAAGWCVATAAADHAALALLEQMPSLILVDPDTTGMKGLETVAAIRRCDEAVADVAILANTIMPHHPDGPLHAHGFDGIISKPCTPGELVREAQNWLPRDATKMLTRLENALGLNQVRALTGRFRTLLAKSLGDLDRADVAITAHRVAGIAGTLGFTNVGTAWLAVSLGDDSALADARREARRGIMAIDRHLRYKKYHT